MLLHRSDLNIPEEVRLNVLHVLTDVSKTFIDIECFPTLFAIFMFNIHESLSEFRRCFEEYFAMEGTRPRVRSFF